MTAREDGERLNGISSAAVAKKTGRTWQEWLKLLDVAGAKKLDHKGIVQIAAKHGAGPWWQQMVTVGYEQARGLRAKNETVSGYQISVTKTLAAPLEKIAFNLPAGKFSHGVELGANYYILKVDEKRGGDAPSFAKLRPEIEKKLMQEESQRQQELWLAGLRQKAYIRTF